jgi:dihydroorotase
VTTWVKGGKLIDPVKRRIEDADLIIDRGRIERILPWGAFKESGPGLEVVDASGWLVAPGFIDIHVHLREPGHEYKETVWSGTRAAAAGGFTAVACMPNTLPPNDCRSVTEFILEQARKAGFAKVFPFAAITMGQKGEILTEFGDLRQAGAVGVSDDGRPVTNAQVMRRALEYARHHGLTVTSHCEDTHLSDGGVMHEGAVSTAIGLRGIPGTSEEVMIYRDIALARLTRCPVHIAHVSTSGSVALVRRAKEEHLSVTAETAPHYFSLDHTAVFGYDTCTKMNPPLRTPEDVAAIKRGLADGVLDAIATDHAPHSSLEKDVEFDKAAFGITGLETALPLTLQLVREGHLSLPDAIGKLTVGPASILGVSGGILSERSEADLVVIDPDWEYVLSEKEMVSKSKNTPFIGKKMTGRTVLTMVGGRIVWDRRTEHPGR